MSESNLKFVTDSIDRLKLDTLVTDRLLKSMKTWTSYETSLTKEDLSAVKKRKGEIGESLQSTQAGEESQ